MKRRVGFMLLVWFAALVCSVAQETSSNPAAASVPGTVPQLVKYFGIAKDVTGKPLSGTVGITFALYKDEQGGAPLWLETQNVQADASGHYTVQLGASQPTGLPVDVFASGEARWLGAQISGQAEQARVLLLSVPYALKAADAATVGGLPPSAFVLAVPASAGPSGSSSTKVERQRGNSPPLGGSGSANYLAIWTDNNGDLGNSAIFQGGTAGKPKVGIGTVKPANTLDVNGGGTIRGLFSLPARGTATATAGFTSQPIDQAASVFNSGTGTAITQTFQWQAEPVGNNTSNAAGSLNLLFGQGSNKPAETGLNLASNGLITFAKGQTFPGTGTITGVTTAAGSGLTGGGTSGSLNLALTNACAANQVLQWNGSAWVCSSAGTGTITGVTAGTDLTGGGTSGNVTLNLDTTRVPQLNSANTFTATQTIGSTGSGGNLALPLTDSTGNFGVLTIEGKSFLHNFSTGVSENTFVGGAGNFATSGNRTTGVGYEALKNNGTGGVNTAIGQNALFNNNAGNNNTGVGVGALFSNTTGNNNTTLGSGADVSSGNLSNATAVGANAVVGESNALVLGGTGGNIVKVGIGTSTPAATLDVEANAGSTATINFGSATSPANLAVNGIAGFTGNITFAPTQTFPGTGTITAVTAGTDLIGGGTSGSVTLNLDTTKVPQLGTANTFTAKQTISGGDLSLSNGNLDLPQTPTGGGAGVINLGGAPFIHACCGGEGNAFLGFAGNLTTTGISNTGTGVYALILNSTGSYNTGTGNVALNNNTTGSGNTASGYAALHSNTTGGSNTAIGYVSLEGNTTGSLNTAVGLGALSYNTIGSNNTALGFNAGPDSMSTNLSNATAIGANAVVSESNALVLGGTGSNAINVGIGTATPHYTLDVNGSGNFAGAVNVGPSGGFLGQLNAAAPSGTSYAVEAQGYNSTAGNGQESIISSGGNADPNGAFYGGDGVYSLGGYADTTGGSGGTGGNGVVGLGGNGDYGGDGGVFYGGTGTTQGGDAVYVAAGRGPLALAGFFSGDIQVSGKITAGTKDFKIDHPLDPANKYLYHASVESSEMMNIYTGNATTDAQGDAVVQLPDWFETLNRDFRYQLTVIGQFAQAIVSSEIANHQFRIKTDKPSVRVSWQVTSVRQDAYAKAHPLVVEEEKSERERGHYLHPELYGAGEEQSIDEARHPGLRRRLQEMREKHAARAENTQNALPATTPQLSAVPAKPVAPKLIAPPPPPAVPPLHIRPSATPMAVAPRSPALPAGKSAPARRPTALRPASATGLKGESTD